MILLCSLAYNLLHAVVLLFHAGEKLVLGVCANEVVTIVAYLVVVVAIDVVHEEAEYLLVGDVDTRECKPINLALSH